MKAPPRKFIVEFKSARRQQTGRTNSIWGKTDFKALTREAEEIAPHLFNSTEATATPKADNRPPVEPNGGIAVEDLGNAEVGRAAINSVETVGVEVSEPQERRRLAADAVVRSEDAPPVSQPLRSSKGGVSRKRRERISVDVREDETGQAKAAEGPISFDELAALDLENQRLKGLLARRIYAENLQLKKMLERFEVT
ncbi:hypothetical protein J2Z31_005434 [Sinorhizobium kostiense]|uniref:Transposase n=1 Tax=Sinorhizobium kostiense TaxID=76747 RepID=A0ABS4R7M9_9HYPH|nr:hypothetical protein [Sinorhizobium kostiense]MBP2238893.1 hypothetical protein [Sinorhizobium kostiense]